MLAVLASDSDQNLDDDENAVNSELVLLFFTLLVEW